MWLGPGWGAPSPRGCKEEGHAGDVAPAAGPQEQAGRLSGGAGKLRVCIRKTVPPRLVAEGADAPASLPEADTQ